MFCCLHTTRLLGTADAARYCSPSCARAAEEDRRARRRGVQLSTQQMMTAAYWRLAVGERYMAGSVVADRPRCEISGKVRYETPSEAWVAAFIDFDDAPGMNAYLCGDCAGMHLGHAKGAEAKAAIRRARHAFDKALRQMLPTIHELRAAGQRAAGGTIAGLSTR